MAAERVLLDPSLLVAASVEEHPSHAASKAYVEGLASARTASRTESRRSRPETLLTLSGTRICLK